MEPYKNHHEHLQDIINLLNLKTDDNEPAALDFMRLITAREAASRNIFLPAAHLKKIYGIENAEYLYIIIALSVLGKSISAIPHLPPRQKMELRLQLREIWDMEKDALKQRIINFILNPEMLLDRPWITFQPHLSGETDEIIIMEETAASISRLTQRFLAANSPHIIWVYGRPGSGRKTHISYASGKLPVLFIDLCQITDCADFEKYIGEIVLESKLMGVILSFDNIDTIVESPKTLRLFLRLIEPVSKVVFFFSQTVAGDWERSNYSLAEVRVPLPDKELAAQMWRSFSKPYAFEKEPDYNDLANRFKLTPLQIKQCLEKTYHLAVMQGNDRLNRDELYNACRALQTRKLNVLGRAVNFSFHWEDLILPDKIKSLLDSAAERIAYQDKVYRQWGFAAKMPYGQGVSVLLEGLPGTGKTMAAHVLAGRLDLPMYKVNLAAVVSKYIGETEKNLQAIFEEAKETDCILFFDEAEAIFSKRTDIKDSKDRYSNLEVSFLLQKLEEHPGVTILATNLLQNFDDAFKRRFQFIIQLPLPDETHRKKIWQSAIPPETPVADDIDFDYLASRFELNGSSIKNILLSAAFYAATHRKILDMACITNALKTEAAKSGIALLL